MGRTGRRGVLAGLAGAALLPAPSFAALAEGATRPVTMPRADRRVVVSAITGRTYRVDVAWPSGEPPASGWPIIYMNDANAQFGMMVETVRLLSWRGEGGMSQAVVVGVGYDTDQVLDGKARSFDLTPGSSTTGNPAEYGGADKYLRFLVEELRPAIEQRFKIDRNHQALFGHSFGGLFALHALMTQPAAFDTYIAASPSGWYGDGLLLREEGELGGAFAAAVKKRAPRLLVTVGAYEQEPSPGWAAGTPNPTERIEGQRVRRQVERAREIAERLGKRGVDAEFHLFAEEDHGSVVPAAISRAVRFALRLPTSLPRY
jgi:uncharacterized protein